MNRPLSRKNQILNTPPRSNQATNAQADTASYIFPPFALLNLPEHKADDTKAEDEILSRRLVQLLVGHDIQAKVINIGHGPAITRFELELSTATSLKNRKEMEKNFATELSVKTLRIVPPYPGKCQFSIEVPNSKATIVTLREILESEQMQNEASNLSFPLGKDTNNTPSIFKLDNKSVLLITGQTESGKSMYIHTIINILLFRAKPDEIRMILIDPSGTELQRYNGIPHLMAPAIHDLHQAIAALNWAFSEMKARFSKFHESQTTEFESYNRKMKENGNEPLNRIVIIIDEFAELWALGPRRGDKKINELLKYADVTGIYLIIATRHYSDFWIDKFLCTLYHDTITFRMAESEDSFVTLYDKSEYLLGKGDLFYINDSPFFPTRIQGPFISNEEIDRVVAHVKKERPSSYDSNLMETIEKATSKEESNSNIYD